MNIVFSLHANMEGTSLSGDYLGKSLVFEKVIRFFSDSIENELCFLFESSIENNTLKAFAHPTENPIFFIVDGENIEVEISSGFTGAGYHAWAVDMLIKFGKKYKLKWKEVAGKEDSTGYFKHKNFDSLSKIFIDRLFLISKSFIEQSQKGVSNFMLAFQEDYPIVNKDYFAISPLGYFEKDWFLNFINTEDENQKYKYAAEFYIWLDKNIDDDFWFKTTLSMIWLYYPFRTFITSEEKKVFAKILYAFEISYKLNSNMDYPFDIWIDIASYLGDSYIANIVKNRMGQAAVNSDIGFRKEFGTTELAGGFSIIMPMSMVSSRDDEAGTVEFYNTTIHTIFQVYAFEENESTENIMDKVIKHIDKAGEKGLKVKFSSDNFNFKVYERKLENNKYLITSIVVKNNLALLGWFTYSQIFDRNNILSFLENIRYNDI